MKTRKSVKKRIRITKNGKVLRRTMGVGHFKSKKSGKSLQNKRSSFKVHSRDRKNIIKELIKVN